MLPLTKDAHGYLRLSYNGPVGVSGNNVQQSWDLSLIPFGVRQSRDFKKNILIFAKQLSVGLSNVSSVVSFLPATGVPDRVVLTLSASSAANQIALDVWCLHTGIGASNAATLHFIPLASSGSQIVPPKSLYVAPSWPGDADPDVYFTTIQAALDKAATLSPTREFPVAIWIADGTYAEDIVLVSNVHLTGQSPRGVRHTGTVTWTPGAGVNAAYAALREEVGFSWIRSIGSLLSVDASAKTGDISVFDSRDSSLPTLSWTGRSIGTIDYCQMFNVVGSEMDFNNGALVMFGTQVLDGLPSVIRGNAGVASVGCDWYGDLTLKDNSTGSFEGGSLQSGNLIMQDNANYVFPGMRIDQAISVAAGVQADFRTSLLQTVPTGAGVADRKTVKIDTGATAVGANAIAISPPLPDANYSVAVAQLTGAGGGTVTVSGKSGSGFTLNDSDGGRTFELTVIRDR